MKNVFVSTTDKHLQKMKYYNIKTIQFITNIGNRLYTTDITTL